MRPPGTHLSHIIQEGTGISSISCLEIKYLQNKPYVYRSTSVYNKTTKSPKEVSTCLGRLTQEAGLIPKGTRGTRHPLPGVNGGIKFPTR